MKKTSEKIIAVYAGSFDPATNGHLWVIKRGAKVFDQLIVAVGDNPDKHCLFSVKERIAMLKDLTEGFSNVKIDSFSKLFLVNYAESVGAKFILRGLRDEGDYKSERGWRNLNGDFNPEITTFFVMPPRELSEISSSMVKGLVGFEGWEEKVKKYVPEAVFEKLKEAYDAKDKR